MNLLFTAAGIGSFYSYGWLQMILLYREGIAVGIECVKLIVCEYNLRSKMHFYFSSNYEEVRDPLLTTISVLDRGK